jgi:hypothetical protein
MGNWPPSNFGMLRELYGASEEVTISTDFGYSVTAGPGKGLACYDRKYVDPLVADGLAYYLRDFSGAAALTEKGKEAFEMLVGARYKSQYAMPDWFLAGITSGDVPT